jgi:hypothetical protein
MVLVCVATAEAQQAKIYGRAKIVFGFGDVVFLSNVRFLALPFSIYDRKMQFIEEANKKLGSEPIYDGGQKSRNRKMQYRSKRDALVLKWLKELIAKAKAEGKYHQAITFEDGTYEMLISPGRWFICNDLRNNETEVQHLRQFVRWAVPLTVQAGEQLYLNLNNENASYISNYNY